MRRKRNFFILVLLSIYLISCLTCIPAEAVTEYEVGQTYSLYTAAAYGTWNEWVSSNTGIVQIYSPGYQYCTIKCLRAGTAYVKVYVHGSRPAWDPYLKMFYMEPYMELYYTYTINVRTPQCILKNTALTKTTASFSFDAPTDALSVQMMQSNDNGVTWVKASTAALNSSSTSAVVSGLKANTSYRFKLSVLGGKRNGDSNILSITTKANVTGVSLNTAQLTIIRGQTKTLTASVLPVNAENKNVTWTLSSKLATVTASANGLASITANGTTNGTLTASAKTVEGGYTASCKITIIDPVPNPPANLKMVSIGDTYSSIGWDEVPGADYYSVYINSTKIGTTTGTKYKFTDLTPMGTNSYYVTASNSTGESAHSNTIQIVQNKLSAVISANGASDQTISINWQLSNSGTVYSNLKGIEYRTLGSAYYSKITGLNSATTINYGIFNPDTIYEIRANSDYFSSNVIYVKTYPSGIKEGAAKPAANIESGFIGKGTKIILTTETADAAIYYSTDGSLPNANSMLYTGPIEINSSSTIKAVAVKSGLGDSLYSVYDYSISLDINNDGIINMTDMTVLGNLYGTKNTDTGFDSSRDINKDGSINIYDLVKLANQIN